MNGAKRTYFDYAATTPVDERVLKVMRPYFTEKFGNAGSLHSSGQEAIGALDNSRGTIAKLIGAEFRNIIFTGSATEANNLALRGAVKNFRRIMNNESGITGKKPLIHNSQFIIPKVIVSAIEHPSVFETAKDLARSGVEVKYLPVNAGGVVDLKELKKELNERTVLTSVMLGNNEIGTIEPIAEISKIIGNFRNELRIRNQELGKPKTIIPNSSFPIPFLHTDAAQAFQYLDCNVNSLGVDFMTISGQKIYGPKGVGALYIRNLKTLLPIISGGSQEFGLRAGTENVAGIVGLAEAAKIAASTREEETKRLSALKAYFIRETKKAVRDVLINGTIDPVRSLPHIINLYFPGKKAEELLTWLDMAGFAVSAGSACSSRSAEPSHVILSLGHGKERARGSIRVSFGRDTDKKAIDKLVANLKKYNRG